MSKQLKIEITGQDQSALFANDFHIMHTPNDFVLSVVEAIPQMKFSMKGRKKTVSPNPTTPITKTSIFRLFIPSIFSVVD